MEIGILGIRGLPPKYGGFETCAQYVAKYWTHQGNNVLVYCRSMLYQHKIKNYYGCRLKYKDALSIRSLETLSHTLNCIIDLIFFERSIKFIHLYNGGNAIFIPLLKLAGKIVIISIDGIEWKRQKWGFVARTMHKLGEYLAVKTADEVIADNPIVQKYYKKKYQRDIALIPYGAETLESVNSDEENKLIERYGLKRKAYFLFVGRFVPEKGLHNLLDTYKKVKTEIPLVLIGDGDDKAYIADLKSRSDSRVRYLGYVYGGNYQVILKNALIYVTASGLEGTSPSLLAAMGARVCVLVNGIEENVASIGSNGVYSKKNNFDDFAERWNELLKYPQNIDDYAEKGYRHVLKNYCWEKIANDYLDVFRTIK
jgi:glycosyltransferase involved in cell wall biosynthesis